MGKAFKDIVKNNQAEAGFSMFCMAGDTQRATRNDGTHKWSHLNPGQWTTLNPSTHRETDVFPQFAVGGGIHAGCIIFDTYMDDNGHPDVADNAVITSPSPNQGAVLRNDNQPNRRWFGVWPRADVSRRCGISFDYSNVPSLARGAPPRPHSCLGPQRGPHTGRFSPVPRQARQKPTMYLS